MASPINVPVLIIGGGGCGLNLSIFLSDLKVEHYLFERHSGTSILPKAHVLNQRTMEIFRQHGMDEDITGPGCPPQNMEEVIWQTTLGGDGPYDRKILGSVPCFGGGYDKERFQRDCPLPTCNLPLVRSEPIFRRIAEERNPGRVLFNHTVQDFDDKGDYVLVTVRDDEGKVQDYHAQYVVAADGGKMSTAKLGVKMEGPTGLVDFVSTHFKADLSKYWDDHALITHFINPEGGSIKNFDCGVLVQMGPTWGRRSEEWTLHFGFALDDKDRFDESKLTPRLRELLKLPELDLKVLHVSHWILERVVADKYWNNSRIFIAGDAAHRRPPTSGLGLNTAIQDAHNIAWKLAFVLNGKADPSLMETYEIERRPIGIQNSDWALFTFTNFGMLNAAFGLMPGQPERNAARFAAIFEDSMMGSSERAQIQACIELQKVEFSSHGIEVGFHYPDNGAIAPDGTEAPPRDPRGMEYIPSTRPGHRLPHAWIGKDHQIFSTHDLTGGPDYPDFVLITDEAGDAWIKEAKRAAQSLKLEIGIARIQSRPFVHEGPDYYEDREGLWTKVRGFKTGGAILVRPDKMVAWRSQAAAAATGESRDDLSASLLRILRKAQPSSTTNGVSNGAH